MKKQTVFVVANAAMHTVYAAYTDKARAIAHKLGMKSANVQVVTETLTTAECTLLRRIGRLA